MSEVFKEIIIDDIKNNQEKWESYLKILDEEYGKYIDRPNELYLIETHENHLPEGDDVPDNFGKLYKKLRKKCFSKFPTVKNFDDNDICPICEGVFSTKVTLEHIIPKGDKGKYQFAILPINLVRCCGECNTSKHQKCSTSEEDSEINPYFEEFDIREYIQCQFEASEETISLATLPWGPRIILNDSLNEVIDRRRKNFIDIYNLIPTYQHRIDIEYNRMISKISKQLVYPLSKQTINIYIEHSRGEYKKAYEKENNWIDQNYFGMLICETLLKLFEEDRGNIDKFCDVIKEKQLNVTSLVFEQEKFLKKLHLDNDIKNLEGYIDWIDKLLSNYRSDFIKYYEHLKKNQIPYKLPKPTNDVASDSEYNVISSVFELYMNDEQRDLTDFKAKCLNIVC